MIDGFARLFIRAEWMTDAACRGKDPNWWHPAKGGNNNNTNTAKAICDGCPVRQQCLQYALDNNEHRGIWGGVSIEVYRRNNPNRTVAQTVNVRYGGGQHGERPQRWGDIEHGTPAGYYAEKRRGNICAACRAANNARRQQLRQQGRTA